MDDALDTRPSKRQRISYGDTASIAASNTQHDDASDMTEAEPAHTGSNGRRTRGWADLPGELRNQIYELCLPPSTFPIAVRSVKGKGKKNVLKWTEMRATSPDQWRWPSVFPEPKDCRPTLNLLLINKATYAEGNTYLYSNEFYFFTSKDLSVFLKSLSVAQKLMLRNLVLELPSPDDAIGMGCGFGMHEQSNFLLSGLKQLEGAMNLKTLQLVLVGNLGRTEPAAWCFKWSLQWLAAEVHKKAQRWLEATSAHKGSNEKAVDLIDVKGIIFRPWGLNGEEWRFMYKGYAESNSEDTSLLRKELVKRMR